jgi:uncharacterized alkaline shock family protein YloU
MTINTSTAPVSTHASAIRGVTHIADRVVEKIAGQAALQVEDVRTAPATGLSRLTGGSDHPSVQAHVDTSTVALEIQLGIDYPSPMRTVARQVQVAVRTTVEGFTGLEVTAIRVNVVRLPTSRPSARRVL